jgi:hypothetical protein
MDYADSSKIANRRIGEMDMLNKVLRVVLNKQISLMGNAENDKAFHIVNDLFNELFKLKPE